MIKLTEDWTAVCIAALIVVFAWLGWVPVLTNSPSVSWLYLFLFSLAIVSLAMFLKGDRLTVRILPGYLLLFVLVVATHLITSLSWVKNLGLEIVLFSLLVGLFISNVLRVPSVVKSLVQTELYIKIGLVLMGTTIVFGDVMQAGAWGLVQSLVVVVVVWQFCFWLGKQFGLDQEMRTLLASAVSICGVSAAIATSGAIQGDGKKLSYVISLVLITAIPMMIAMPYAAQAMNLTPAEAGAWLGGTIDTTGAVVAAGNLLGEEALTYATVVKFSQNVLLGLAAFGISLYWSYTHHASPEEPSVRMIWQRFPKFVLGFVVASVIFSFLLPADVGSALKAPVKATQTFWFALAFICIGLETRVSDIFTLDQGKPAWVFILAQVFNILFTLVVAWFLF
jgi:uncharacterized integral membrane protein (TIGR00698 family)